MIRLAALAAVVLLAVSACGGSGSADGGSGVVTADRIGSLEIDASTRAAVVAFAGKPDLATTGTTGWPGVPRYHALAYSCVHHDGAGVDPGGVDRTYSFCRTVYYVSTRSDKLVALWTDSPDFRTTNGIRPGMAQNAADHLEHQTPQGPWNAIGEATPDANLILPSTCHRVKAGRCSGKVWAFMLESRRHPIGITFT